MMKRAHKMPMTSGDEQDALTPADHHLHWKPGERKKIKQKYSRRQRAALKQEVMTETACAIWDDAHQSGEVSPPFDTRLQQARNHVLNCTDWHPSPP